VLANDIANAQKRQKDFYVDLDAACASWNRAK
jgi:hypothetical protein